MQPVSEFSPCCCTAASLSGRRPRWPLRWRRRPSPCSWPTVSHLGANEVLKLPALRAAACCWHVGRHPSAAGGQCAAQLALLETCHFIVAIPHNIPLFCPGPNPPLPAVSHEIRTPLNGMIAVAQVCHRACSLSWLCCCTALVRLAFQLLPGHPAAHPPLPAPCPRSCCWPAG